MNDFYKLAFSLGAPIVIEPEWSEYQKAYKHALKLLNNQLHLESVSSVRNAQMDYKNAVEKHIGIRHIKINWKTGEVTKV